MLNSVQENAKSEAKAYFLRGSVVVAAAMGGVILSSSPISKNIIGIGIGAKVTSGTIIAGQDTVRVYVRVKIPKSQLPTDHIIPQQFSNLPTDVIEIGNITAFQRCQATWQRFSRIRPNCCGVSVGHPNVMAGTLGCLVEVGGIHYVLSNNHVLANCNSASVGDPIIQPGSADGGSPLTDRLATLSSFKPIDFSGLANDIDAAMAEVGSSTQTVVNPDIIDIGRPQRIIKPVVLYQSVRKHGRTTGHTVGVVTDLSADIWVGYRMNNHNLNAWFEDQIAVTGIGFAPFSRGGDSGSLIVDAVTLEPVALLFAGGNTLTFANPIAPVL